MKVLYLYRGYGKTMRNSVVEAQIKSLQNKIEVKTYAIDRGGLLAYLKTVFALKKYLKNNPVDLIHAHYSFSGFMASLTFFPKVVCSLMGSDLLRQNAVIRQLTIIFYKFIWQATIVKSAKMKTILKNARLLPNGVDLAMFYPMQKETALKSTDLDASCGNVIFVAENIFDPVKNFQLAQKAVSQLEEKKVKLVPLSSLAQEKLNFYYNAADLLLLTSLSEGSPNVVKEAMACNCPIVATDVGDSKQVIGATENCHVVSFDPLEIAKKISEVLASGQRTHGREKIAHLDSALVADQLIQLYRQVAG
jgi:glycosyltransferase involved in cell wall biosynthesis